jgi:histidinol phosphatase-like PHP family hydrolase
MIDYHIHTNQIDGTLPVEEIINMAHRVNVQIAITEHIRRSPTYNWFEFRDSIKRLDSNVLVGVEAKVLDPQGTLDVSDDILSEADIVLGSMHSIGKVEWLLNSKCDIIAHPQITEANLPFFERCSKTLEINALHRLPLEILDKLVESNTFSFGSDTHTLADFYRGQEYFQTILQRHPNIKVIKEIKA